MSDLDLNVSQLCAGYGQVQVLRGINVRVQAGQTVALIGPNGHGKTTFLRALSGLLPGVTGSAQLNGVELVGMPAEQIVQRGITHIPQGDLVFGAMSVEDNLLMGAYPTAAYAERLQSLVKIYELLPRLAERRKQYANTLSGGERRMLALGRGLMSRALLLLIDEPSLGLAPIVIDDIYAILHRLRAHGTSMILVEENARRVVDLADRVHLIDAGQVLWSGTGDQVISSSELLSTYLGA